MKSVIFHTFLQQVCHKSVSIVHIAGESPFQQLMQVIVVLGQMKVPPFLMVADALFLNA